MGELSFNYSVFDLSDFVYSADSNENFLEANDILLSAAGFKKESDILGKNCLELQMPWHSNFQEYVRNNNQVKDQRRPGCFIELLPQLENPTQYFLSIKAPIISTSNKVEGIAGVSLFIDFNSLNSLIKKLAFAADNFNFALDSPLLLRLVAQLNHLKETQPRVEEKKIYYGDVTFSLREAQCLHYFLNNYSAQETAKSLFISKKTVETHLANIKIKLQCNKRAEITQKAIALGFIELMIMKI